MTNEMYRRMRELEKVLTLHFSDLGVVFDFQSDVKKIAIMNDPLTWMPPHSHITSSAMPNIKYGDLITIQLKFKPF